MSVFFTNCKNNIDYGFKVAFHEYFFCMKIDLFLKKFPAHCKKHIYKYPSEFKTLLKLSIPHLTLTSIIKKRVFGVGTVLALF